MDNNNMTETTPKTQAIINSTTANYALNGKIMLSSVLILFFVIFSVVFFHTYSRCRRRRRPRTHFDLHDSQPHLYLISGFRRRNSSVAETVLPGFRKNGLDPSLLASLPTFLFPDVDDGPATASAPAECAVCLSEFEAGDKIRALPKCRHAFHAACIDAWFRSHSNCPLCRSPVAQPDPDAEESAPPVPPSPPPPSSASGDVRVEVPANDPGASEPRDDESGSSERCERKPRSDLAGLASRDDQTGLGEPDRNRVMVRCSLKRIWSI